MKITINILLLSTLLFGTGCGESKKENNGALGEKKATLEKLKADQAKINGQVDALQKEIEKLDTSSANKEKAKLVAVQTVASADFSHFIELQGKIDAENISYITPRGGPGQVKQIFVKKGDYVHKGQLLLKLDDAIINQQIAASKQGLETLKSQLNFAKDIAQRQQNLWDQKIGTEVQLLTAKSNVNNLQTQLDAAQESIKTIQEQLKTSLVYSDVNGVADEVGIRVGEQFTGAPPLDIKIINSSSLKATTSVPENYLSSVKNGTPVAVQVLDINKTFSTSISFLGASIDPLTRGFIMDAKLPSDLNLKPNQNALIKIKDYSAPNAITIPVNCMQTDEKGKFVMLAVNENGKLRARKRQVFPGQLYGDNLEIKMGLNSGETIITEGFQAVYEGQLLGTK